MSKSEVKSDPKASAQSAFVPDKAQAHNPSRLFVPCLNVVHYFILFLFSQLGQQLVLELEVCWKSVLLVSLPAAALNYPTFLVPLFSNPT